MDLGPDCTRCGHPKELHKSFAAERWCLGPLTDGSRCGCDLYQATP